jgi:hypothetical protein
MTSKISILFLLSACMYVCVQFLFSFSCVHPRDYCYIYTHKYLFFVSVADDQHTSKYVFCFVPSLYVRVCLKQNFLSSAYAINNKSILVNE